MHDYNTAAAVALPALVCDDKNYQQTVQLIPRRLRTVFTTLFQKQRLLLTIDIYGLLRSVRVLVILAT